MRIIRHSNAAELDASLFGRVDEEVIDYLDREDRRAKSQYSDRARNFMRKSREVMRDLVNINQIEASLQSMGRRIGSVFRQNEFRYLQDMTDLQFPPLEMLDYIMANPVVRKRYHENRCDGFSSKYHDTAFGVSGEEHYEYRRATNGQFIRDEDGTLHATTHFEELRHAKDELTPREQFMLMDAWDAYNAVLEQEDSDPTSPLNAKL